MATFPERQKRSNFRFHRYRRDGAQDIDFESLEYWAFDVPQPGVYPGVQKTAILRGDYDYPLRNIGGGLRSNARPASLPGVRQRLRRRLLPRRLHWSKDLGIGGNGLASLFFLSDGSPIGRRQYFVAKCNHSGGEYANVILREEKIKTDEFQDAMHIIQTRRIPPVQNPRSSRRVRAREGPQTSRRWDQHDRDMTGIMLLEYCQRGSLDKALSVSALKDIRFPERALWHMFHCLIEALIALAYPPPQHGNLYNGLLPPFMERIPENEEKARWVHFDIDPQNILVHTSQPGSEHPLVPSLKLCDFGLATGLSEEVLRKKDHMLTFRTWAKHFFFTPEQFSAEWDYIPWNEIPATTYPRPRVAGNFTWKTNLFQMGAVMACLITKCYPPAPPRPGRLIIPGRDLDPSYYSDAPDDNDEENEENQPPVGYGSHTSWSSHNPLGTGTSAPPNPQQDYYGNANKENYDPDDGPDGDPVGNGYIRVWSYGHYLLSDEDEDDGGGGAHDHVSWTLRHLVAQCLADDPRYRPSLAWLEREISNNIQDRWGDEPDDGESSREVREWIKECLDVPVPRQ
ncbi:uncharacterized protein B0H64DRAFT_344810, partial [Chaetomium fimeti]